MERLEDYIQGERVVRELRRHVPEALEALASDLEAPLNPALERALARSLDDGRVPDFVPSRVLMPAMLSVFDTNLAALAEGELAKLEAICDGCAVKGRCWSTLRDYAGVEACRRFCPNAERFLAGEADMPG